MIRFIATCSIVLGVLFPTTTEGLVDRIEYVAEEEAQEVIVEEEVVEDKSVGDLAESTIYCSCIKTARLFGAEIPLGTNAGDLSANTEPAKDTVMLLEYPNAYHVAVVKDIIDEGYVIVEGNMVHCELQERVVPLDYYAIRGFWTPQS